MKYRLPFLAFAVVTFIYFLVGIMQLLVDPDFMTFLLNEGGRGVGFQGRGVISLTPEPSFYGTMCLFFIMFSLLHYSKKQNFIIIPFLLFQMAFLAQTATALGILVLALIGYFFYQLIKFRIKFIVVFFLIVAVITVNFNKITQSIQDSRVGYLVELFLENPTLLATYDQSASDRLTHAISPYLVIRHNYFLPMGYGSYIPLLHKLYRERKYKSVITIHTILHHERLSGGINMVLFHMGFIGLLLPLAIYLAFKKILHHSHIVFVFLVFMIILFTQIQLMHSMMGLIIALALYRSRLETSMKLVQQGLQ